MSQLNFALQKSFSLLPLCARSKSNLDNWPPRVTSFDSYSREFPVGTVNSGRHGFTPAPAATGKLCLAWTRAVSQDVSLAAVFGEVACCVRRTKHRSKNALVCIASVCNAQLFGLRLLLLPSLLCKE